MSEARFTLYTTAWCGFCHALKQRLDAVGVRYDEIDIESDPDAAARVEEINDGDRTVPTLVFPDGTALTNPTFEEVRFWLG